MTAVEVFAPAKVNLTLHVTGRRADGYHTLDSLVAFADIGDRLTLSDSTAERFAVGGPFANGVPNGPDNLVVRAARLVPLDRPVSIHLDKRLPPASGIGGGSADAAAAIRGMLRLRAARPEASGAPDTDTAVAAAPLLALGADVPMCVASRPLRARGIGDRIDPVDGLPPLPAVLVNPMRVLATPAVFAALACRDNPPMSDPRPALASPAALADWLAGQRNDLQAAAEGILPEIAEVTSAISGCDGALLARMSGSGATCFGLFEDAGAAAAAAGVLSARHPGWWVVAAVIGDQSRQARPVVRQIS